MFTGPTSKPVFTRGDEVNGNSCRTWRLIFGKIMKVIFVRLMFLRSRLIDGETCKQCKVSLVARSVMGGLFSLGHAIKSAI